MGFCAVWLLRPTVGSLVVVGTCARKEWKEKGRERDICGGRGGGEVASLWTLSNDCKLFDSKLPVVLYSVLYIAPLPDMVALFPRIASSCLRMRCYLTHPIRAHLSLNSRVSPESSPTSRSSIRLCLSDNLIVWALSLWHPFLFVVATAQLKRKYQSRWQLAAVRLWLSWVCF